MLMITCTRRPPLSATGRWRSAMRAMRRPLRYASRAVPLQLSVTRSQSGATITVHTPCGPLCLISGMQLIQSVMTPSPVLFFAEHDRLQEGVGARRVGVVFHDLPERVRQFLRHD